MSRRETCAPILDCNAYYLGALACRQAQFVGNGRGQHISRANFSIIRCSAHIRNQRVLRTIDHFLQGRHVPIVANHPMRSRSSAGVDGSMPWSGVGWNVVVMPIGHHETLLGEPLKSSFSKSVCKAIKIFLAHLVNNDAHHQLWLFWSLLRKCRGTKRNCQKNTEKESFHRELENFPKDRDY